MTPIYLLLPIYNYIFSNRSHVILQYVTTRILQEVSVYQRGLILFTWPLHIYI